MEKVKVTTTMPADDWRDARVAAAEAGIPAGDVLALGVQMLLLRATLARGEGDARPAPDALLGKYLLLAEFGILTQEAADEAISAWAAACPCPQGDDHAHAARMVGRLAAPEL